MRNIPNPTGMAIHTTNAGMPVQGRIPNSQPTKPCPKTIELDWWQLGIEAVLAIHVSGARPNQFTRKRKAPDNDYRNARLVVKSQVGI
jgi:hypothetical protein